ncbi:transcription elongation factor A protein-like 1 [Saccopteryx leptura]|uniref:transcription elongation factor A protein-like 1 n=1 Tax=Saccopteryx leptura TaxID=249018 RepID=UPI00339BAED7
MDKACQANEEQQPQSTSERDEEQSTPERDVEQSMPERDEEQPQAENSPEEPRPEEPSSEEPRPEEPSSEEQSSEEEFFPEDILPELIPDLLPELLGPEYHPSEERLSLHDLFAARPAMEQPPCGVGKQKLEEGSFKERLARSRPQFKGDIHGRNLSNEEMIQVAEEMEEMKRVRNKLMIMHWKARRNRPYPL